MTPEPQGLYLLMQRPEDALLTVTMTEEHLTRTLDEVTGTLDGIDTGLPAAHERVLRTVRHRELAKFAPAPLERRTRLLRHLQES